MKRRPSIREWLATALSVACAVSLFSQLRRIERPTGDELAGLKAEHASLAVFSEQRLHALRLQSAAESALPRIGPEWQRNATAKADIASRTNLAAGDWAGVLVDLRTWSARRKLLRVAVRATASGWDVEATLKATPAPERAESR